MSNPHHLLLNAYTMVSDKYGRQLRDLRISVTDRCNFRCRYCMPREKFGSDHTFMPKRAFLSFDEIEKVVKSCKELGLQKVRITGGEPLLRPNLPDLIKNLGGTPIMSPTGHFHIKNGIKEHNPLLAGEMSGHIFFNDKWHGHAICH